MLLYLRTFGCILACIFLLLPRQVHGQKHYSKITGVVLHAATGKAIAGAGVVHSGSNTAVVTDKQGRFSIYAQPHDTLLVKAMGFKPARHQLNMAADTTQPIVIKLQEEPVQLREVQVYNLPSQVKKPNYRPAPKLPPPPPAPPPTILFNPASYFSKEGKQRRKLRRFLAKEEEKRKLQEAERLKQEQEQTKQNYNRFFKDNTGYQ